MLLRCHEKIDESSPRYLASKTRGLRPVRTLHRRETDRYDILVAFCKHEMTCDSARVLVFKEG